MPRKLDPAFLDKVRELAAKGYNQVQIAAKLHTNQPRISYVMRKHAIPTENYAAVKRATLAQAAGALHAYVFLQVGNETIREQRDATPEQLEALAAYMRGLREQAAALFNEAENTHAPEQ